MQPKSNQGLEYVHSYLIFDRFKVDFIISFLKDFIGNDKLTCNLLLKWADAGQTSSCTMQNAILAPLSCNYNYNYN